MHDTTFIYILCLDSAASRNSVISFRTSLSLAVDACNMHTTTKQKQQQQQQQKTNSESRVCKNQCAITLSNSLLLFQCSANLTIEQVIEQ